MNLSKLRIVSPSRPALELGRRLIVHCLEGLRGGEVILSQSGYPSLHLGQASTKHPIEIQVLDSQVFNRIARSGSLAAGETYVEGLWRCSDLHALLALISANRERLDFLDSSLSRFVLMWHKLNYRLKNNRKRQAKRNILAHYDISNEFYQAFLDPLMQYSCAYYPCPVPDLAQAQLHKLDRIAEQLELKESDHLLEIGSGWGGLAVYLAKKHGCRVTTTTISDKQYQFACQRVKESGLTDRVTVLNKDYRDLRGKFDKLVSIEMIEAVGEAYLPGFVKRCDEHLKPGGRMVLQAITIDEARYDLYRQGVDFIQQYVFPGGFLPTQPLLESLYQEQGMTVESRQPLALDYARTLNQWHQKVQAARRERSDDFGFDETFYRLWHFYFAYCEAGFRSGNIGAWQLTFSKPS